MLVHSLISQHGVFIYCYEVGDSLLSLVIHPTYHVLPHHHHHHHHHDCLPLFLTVLVNLCDSLCILHPRRISFSAQNTAPSFICAISLQSRLLTVLWYIIDSCHFRPPTGGSFSSGLFLSIGAQNKTSEGFRLYRLIDKSMWPKGQQLA